MKDLQAQQPKASKTCNNCKARKVRCVIAENSTTRSCISCTKRKIACHFSVKRRKSQPPPLREATRPDPEQAGAAPRLYVDHLLDNRSTCGRRRNEGSVVKAHDNYVGSSGLAFFSDKRIASISDRLGHNRFRGLIESIVTLISSRMNRNPESSSLSVKFSGPLTSPVPVEIAKSYVSTYFVHVHPLYPFIDRKEFEKNAFGSETSQHPSFSAPFSALYHSILALGCQHQDGGTFDSGKGGAWKLFQTSLGLLPEIMVPKEGLMNLQAVTAMAIFAHNSSCLQIGNMLTTEAARMAQLLGFNKAIRPEENEEACHRTFWVIYILEKTASFACGRASIISDYDIGAPIPETFDAIFQGFDWFHTMARLGRLLSRAYEMLFSTSATLNSAELCHTAISAVSADLEAWRNTIPEQFRPGDPFQPTHLSDHLSMTVALRTHYYYHSVVIALSRLSLHVDEGSTSSRKLQSKEALLNAARLVIELTRYIDTEAHAPIWVLGSMPMSALFILFDFVVHNPTHPNTKSNLSLLGVAAGYFCRLEYASSGSLPSSLLSEFATIARQYVEDLEAKTEATEPANFGPQSTASSGLQTPPTSVSMYNNYQVEDMMGDPPRVEGMDYPASGLQFSMMGGLPDGMDMMGLFDNIVMDYRMPMEWNTQIQDMGTQAHQGH